LVVSQNLKKISASAASKELQLKMSEKLIQRRLKRMLIEQRKKDAALEEEELISIQIFNDPHQYFIDIPKKMDDEYEEAMQWAAVHASKRFRKALN